MASHGGPSPALPLPPLLDASPSPPDREKTGDGRDADDSDSDSFSSWASSDCLLVPDVPETDPGPAGRPAPENSRRSRDLKLAV